MLPVRQETIVRPEYPAQHRATVLAVAQRAIYTFGFSQEVYDSIKVKKLGHHTWKVMADLPDHPISFKEMIEDAFGWFHYKLMEVAS